MPHRMPTRAEMRRAPGARKPPGPGPLSSLNSALALGRDPIRFALDMWHRYGDLVRIRFLLWQGYLVFHPDQIKHILQDNHRNYTKDFFTLNAFKAFVGNGLITNNGDSWLQQRRLMQLGLLAIILGIGITSFTHAFSFKSKAQADAGSSSPTNYLYVENGLGQDSISGFKIVNNTLVPLPGSPYPTGGKYFQPGGGTNSLATSTANGTCVFNTDSQGQVESFSVDRSTGVLTYVTQITIGSFDNPAAGAYISQDGKTLFSIVTSELGPGSKIFSIPVGSNCSLGSPVSTFSQSAFYEGLALVSPTQLLAVDIYNSNLDLYQINQDSSLTLHRSTHAQISSAEGAAVMKDKSGTYIFTGQGNNGMSTAEGFQLKPNNILQPLSGSPYTDSQGTNGIYVMYDMTDQQLLQTEMFSNSLGLYNTPFGNSQQYVTHVALPNTKAPAAMIQLGNTLFVLGETPNNPTNDNYGLVDICTVAKMSASCQQGATLPKFSRPAGIGVLSL